MSAEEWTRALTLTGTAVVAAAIGTALAYAHHRWWKGDGRTWIHGTGRRVRR